MKKYQLMMPFFYIEPPSCCTFRTFPLMKSGFRLSYHKTLYRPKIAEKVASHRNSLGGLPCGEGELEFTFCALLFSWSFTCNV